MSIVISTIAHVQVTVPIESLDACAAFYGQLLRLRDIPKPDALKGNPGVWYTCGGVELHLSGEAVVENASSKRHVCYVVQDLALTEAILRSAGIAVEQDRQPIPGWRRIYVRDPGGNRVELAQTV